ncbi:FKBP-type peptidyl-prolyl cis-trans isomerase [Timonella sp. A28]|uniref:FKBP-type peptidyl-prolyl cis-trans isomerase n=1 Tax=Timonella sp. A28 TaxID=3442640 RepID=UPI003EBD8830
MHALSLFRGTRFRTVTTALAVCCTAGLVLSGCSEPEEEPTVKPTTSKVTVTGTADEVPKIEYDEPFVFEDPVSEVLWEGAGEKIDDGSWMLLRMHVVDPDTGEPVRSDYEGVPAPYFMDEETIGTELYDLVKDVPAGSRVMQVTGEGSESRIIVMDVLPAMSVGEEKSVEEGMPEISYSRSGEPKIKIPKGLKKPEGLAVQQLKTGGSQQVEANSQVVVQYVAATWKKGKVIDSTWDKKRGPVTVQIGSDQLISGLDQNLLGAPVGSQLLIVIPPELGFGPSESALADDTLIYVVDILAASQGRE